MPRYLGRDQVALAAAVVVPLAVAAALVPVRTRFSAANAALVLVVVVVAVAANGHRLAGAVAALSAAVWFDFFLTQPYEHFTITASDDIVTAVLLLVVGLAVSQLAARARRLRVIAITDADYLDQIHRTAQMVESGAAANAVVNQVREQLVHLLHLQGCRFEYGNLLGHPPRLLHDGNIVQGRTRWDLDHDGLP
jgi:K+-sensing histidine kinase KdpD